MLWLLAEFGWGAIYYSGYTTWWIISACRGDGIQDRLQRQDRRIRELEMQIRILTLSQEEWVYVPDNHPKGKGSDVIPAAELVQSGHSSVADGKGFV